MNSKRILDVVNQLTMIHNQIVENKLFSAGFNLAVLQDELVREMKKAEEKESHEKLA